MKNRIFKVDNFQFGEGANSGHIACLMALLSFLRMLAFHSSQGLVLSLSED